MATLNGSTLEGIGSGSGPRCQDTILGDVNTQTRFEIPSKQSNDPPFSRGYTPGSGEDNMKLIGIDEILYTTLDETHNVVAFLEKPKESDGFAEIIDFLKASSVHYALTVNPIIYISCIEQFWATAKVQTVNGVRQLQALVDKKRVIVTKSSIRRDLDLDKKRVIRTTKTCGLSSLNLGLAALTLWTKVVLAFCVGVDIIVYCYALYPELFEAPPSPDYVLGPEEPELAPLSLEFVPEPVYPEFMPPEDDVLPAEEQPLPAVVLPTTDSPGYIADSDPKEDPEEDPTDYPADGGDYDDGDDDVEKDEDEEEEEEYPASADSVPPPVHRVTAMMSIRDEPPTPFWSEAEIARLLVMPSPPPSPLSSWSSPLP
ncbi:hypothetical protein Tco_0189832 [Tanacetum coccineum]